MVDLPILSGDKIVGVARNVRFADPAYGAKLEAELVIYDQAIIEAINTPRLKQASFSMSCNYVTEKKPT